MAAPKPAAIASMPSDRWLVPLTSWRMNRSYARFSNWRISCSLRYIARRVAGSMSAASWRSCASGGRTARWAPYSWSASGSLMGRLQRVAGVDVGLAVALGRQRSSGGVVAPSGNEQLLGGELGDDLASGFGDDDFLLDAGGAPSVVRRPVRLEREHLTDHESLRVLDRGHPAEYRPFPDAQAAVVAPGLTSPIALSTSSRQIWYAPRWAGDALPTANVR